MLLPFLYLRLRTRYTSTRTEQHIMSTMYKVEKSSGELLGNFRSVKAAHKAIENFFQCSTIESLSEIRETLRRDSLCHADGYERPASCCMDPYIKCWISHMNTTNTHTGILKIIKRLDNSRNQNPRFLVSIDGIEARTVPDASLGYAIQNHEGNFVTARIGTYRGRPSIVEVLESRCSFVDSISRRPR